MRSETAPAAAGLPATHRSELDARYVNARRKLLAAAAAQFLGSLRAARIDGMLIKGEATALSLYPSTELRLMRDIDVLVRKSDEFRTENVLRNLGYRPTLADVRGHEVADHSRPWTRGVGATVVEVDLHTSFHGVRVSSDELWGCWRPPAQALRIGDDEFIAPSLATTVLIVALHRNRSPEGSAACRDLELAIEVAGLDIWRDAAAQARRLDCESTMTAGLLLHPRGEALLSQLGMSTHLSRRESLLGDPGRGSGLGWYDWSQLPTWAERSRRLRQEVWPSHAGLVVVYPYAGRGGWRIPLARTQRFFDLLRTAPQGLYRAFRPRR